MVAIVSGNSLGLSLTSLATLGQRGLQGSAGQGRSGEQAFVNIANGNLVLQGADDKLVGRGLDINAVRTYNSQGLLNDDNGDGWLVGAYGQSMKLSGTVATAGSTLVRTDRDGAAATYSWNASRNLYVSSAGSGAFDTVSYDSAAQRFTWTDGGTGVQERYESTGQGKLVSATDAAGNTVAYTYNANGTLQKMVDANGETTYFDYAGYNLTQIRTEASGGAVVTRVRYTYDASNRLATVTVDLSPNDNSVADGKTYVTTYTYDGSSKRVASVTQSDGTSLAFTYVQVGTDYRVATVKDGLGQTTSYSYDTTNRRTTVVDPLGLTTFYTYDASGQLTQIQAPAIGGVSQLTLFAYDASGNVTQVTDPMGFTVTMQYDANGNQTLQRDAVGNTISRTFDTKNQVLTETVYLTPDPDGAGSGQPSVPATTRYVYDAAGKNQLRFVLSAEGRVTEYRYNIYGQQVSVHQYAGGKYNVAALTSTASPSESQLVSWAGTQDLTQSSRTDTIYDARGQVQKTTAFSAVDSAGVGIIDGTESVTQYVYDRAGLLLSTISPTGGSTQFVYDGLGRQLSSQDALSQTTLTSYDDANNKTTVTLANGLITTSAYDKNGRLISIAQSSATNAALGTTLNSYDKDGRLIRQTDPTGAATGRVYDEAGRLVGELDATNRLTEYIFDKNNQVTQKIVYATPVAATTVAAYYADPNSAPANRLASLRPAANPADQKSWRIYDGAGRLIRTIDAVGAIVDLRYDGASRLVGTTEYSQRATADALQNLGPAPAAGALTAVLDPNDRVTRRFYDSDGLLIGLLDAEGYLTESRYDAKGRLIAQIAYATATAASLRAGGTLAQLVPALDGKDQTSRWIYDDLSRVAAQIDAEGYMTEYVYDAYSNVTSAIRYATAVDPAVLATVTSATTAASLRPAASAGTRTTSSVYDKLNRVVQRTNYEGTVTQFEYDSLGNLLKTTRAVGTAEVQTVTARYDVQGRLTGELTAEGSALLVAGQTQAQIDSIWSQYGLTHTYDAGGRRTSTSDAYGNKTLFYYDAESRLTQTVNALGEVTEQHYNALGQLDSTTRYGTRLSSLSGLTGGLVTQAFTSTITALKNASVDSVQTFTYTATGQISTATDALGNVTQSTYNAFGDLTGKTQALGGGRQLTQSLTVDHRGKVTSTVSDASGVNAITSAVYDAFGRLTSSTDANGNVRQQRYDRLGRMVGSTDSIGAVRSATYDAFDRVLTQTDALGQVTTFTYNSAARSVAVTTPENITVTTTYTRLGQKQSVVDGNGNTTTFAYDKNGNLTSTSTALTTVTNTYDRSGRLATTKDANGTITTLAYDAANRVLTRTVDATGLNLVTTFTYDAKGQQYTITDPNNVATVITYDLKGQVISRAVDPTGLNLVTRYSYDGAGNTLTVVDPNSTTTQYVYDNLGRRIQTRVDPAGLNLTTAYAYDKNGNLISRTDPNLQVTRYAYDAADRLVFTLDPMGDLQRTKYDAEGRVSQTTAYAAPIDVTDLSAAPSVSQLEAKAAAIANAAKDATEYRVRDKDGRLTATVNGLGEVVRYIYDANGNVTDRLAYANRITLATWTVGTLPAPAADSSRDLRLRSVYDQLNRATYTIDGIGAVTRNVYDGNGNVVERFAYAAPVPTATAATTSALSTAVALVANSAKDAHDRFIFDRANRMTWRADGVGAVTQWVYDNNGNVLKTVEYATAISATAVPSTASAATGDRITDMVYDRANRQVFVTNALGGLTETVYDKNGNVTTRYAFATAVTAPTATSKLTEAQIRAARVYDYAGADRVTRAAYDAANRQILAVDAAGAVTETGYDAAGNAIMTKSYARPIVLTSLQNNLTASVSTIRALMSADTANDRTVKRTFDAANRLVYTVDSLGYVKLTSYDGLGHITQTVDYWYSIPPATANTGDAVKAAIVKSTASDRTSSFSYDAAGRLLSTTDSLNFTESYAYNGLGQKVSFTNKKNSTWTYTYDAGGRLTKETAPSVQLAAVTTDSNGNLVIDASKTGAANVITQLAYDALGNLKSRTEAVGRPEQRTTSYEYDALGHQIRVNYPSVGVYNASGDTLTTNGASGLASRTETTQALYTLTSYDVFGNATTNRDVAGSYSYKAYDVLGKLRYEVDALGYVTGYQRNTFGEVSELKRFAVATTLVSGNPARLTVAQISSAVSAAGVNHGADRAITTTYDRLGRVAKVIEPQSYVYDSSAAAGSQYASAGRTTVNTYNAFGDVIRVGLLKNASLNTWVYTNNYYSLRGELTTSVDAAGYATTQTFDGVGNLTSRTEFAKAIAGWNGGTASTTTPPTIAADANNDRKTTYAYDRIGQKTSETRVNVEYSAASNATSTRGNLTTSYAYDAVGNLLRTANPNGDVSYSYYDALGRVTATASLVNAAGNLTAVTKYQRDAYGNAVSQTQTHVYKTSASADPLASVGTTSLAPNQVLTPGSSIYSPDGRYILTFQTDSNLVMYDMHDGAHQPIWHTDTYGKGADKLLLQSDGNLVMYKGTEAVWASGTTGQGGTSLKLQNDGNLVLYTSANAGVWWTGQDNDFQIQPDRTSYTRYDILGRAVQSTDAAGVSHYSSYDAAGHVAKEWQLVTDDATTRTLFRAYQYDKLGQQTHIIDPASTSVVSNGTISTVTQQQAGVVDTVLDYNAFGELTAKGVNGTRQEYFDYDNAGRLWRTNSGDGVDKIALYDLVGNQTANITSFGTTSGNVNLKTYSAPDQAAQANLRRTDMVYNAIGQLKQTVQAVRTEATGGVSVSRLQTQAVVTSSSSEVRNESQTLTGWTGTNAINLNWSPLRNLGSGDLKVVVEYTTKTYVVEGAQSNESSQQQMAGGTIKTRSQLITNAAEGTNGFLMSWSDDVNEGIAKVNKVAIYKKDAYGYWQPVIANAPVGYSGQSIDIDAPDDPAAAMRLQMRPAGSSGDSGWADQPLINFGDMLRFDASALAAGSYEYKVTQTTTGGTTSVTASGTVTLSSPPLALISAPMGFYRPGVADMNVFSWQSPDSSIDQVFRYRPAGSSGAWTTVPVSSIGSGNSGVDLSALVAAGNYQFELLWIHAGEGVPYAHATGTITSSGITAPQWIPPQNLPQIGGIEIMAVGANGNDESGMPIGGTNGYAIKWPLSAVTGHAGSTPSVTFRYRLEGSSQWNTLAVSTNGGTSESGASNGYQMVNISSLPDGRYDYEIVAASTSGGAPMAQAKGTLINNQAPIYQTVSGVMTVPVQVQVGSDPVYARDEAGNILYQTVYETHYETRQVPVYGWVQFPYTEAYNVWVQGSPQIAGYDEQNQPIYVRDGNGNIVYNGWWETRYRTAYSWALVVTGWNTETYPVQVPVQQPIITGYQPRYETQYTTVPYTYQVQVGSGKPAVEDHTPPYTPGTWTPFIPALYSTSVTTPANSAAVSENNTDGANASVSTGVQGISSTVRPVVNQNTDRWGNVISISDPRSANWVTTYRYNANNQLIEQKQTDADGNQGTAGAATTQLFYDKLGRQVAVKDANGNVQGTVYDARGNVLQELHADTGVIRNSYNVFGDKVATTDAMNNVTTFTYDSLGRLLTTNRGVAQVYVANNNNQLATLAATRAIVETNVYDQAGRKLSQTNGNGETIRYVYDMAGRVVRTIQPLGQTTKVAYDAMGNKVGELDGNGYLATWSYSYFGRTLTHTDFGGHSFGYTYDNAGQLTRDSGTNRTYTYNSEGLLARVVDGNTGQDQRYEYDFAGNRVREWMAQSGVTYQDNRIAYDALGRMRWVADGRAFITLEYDKVGNRTRIKTHVLAGDSSLDSDKFFKYDAMNRQTVVDAIDASGNLGTQGHEITYDKNGNRASDRWWGNQVVTVGGQSQITGYDSNNQAIYSSAPTMYLTTTGYTREEYRYDALGRLASVVRDGVQTDRRLYDGASRVVQSGPAGALPQAYVNALNGVNWSLQTLAGTGSETRINRYNANGQIIHQDVLKSDNLPKYSVEYSPLQTSPVPGMGTTGGYDNAGNLQGYTVFDWTSQNITNYSNTYGRAEGYRQLTSFASSTLTQPGLTSWSYGNAGELTGITDAMAPMNNRTFVSDMQGNILYSNQGGQEQYQLVVNGQVLGRYGKVRDANNPTLPGGVPLFNVQADFNFGYQPIDGNYPSSSPGTYAVGAGDTLQSIARGAYGDQSLWYLIADANGLSGNGDLKSGQVLTIPSRVGSSNSASSFKPYDPTKVIGDTTPTPMAMPQGNGGGGCGGLGQIIVAVVAVVVTIYTAGVAGAYFGAAGAAGAGGFSGGLAVLGGAGGLTSASIGAAMVGGAAGSLASQTVGVAIGAQDSINWKGVALGAVGAGVTAGLGAAGLLPNTGNAFVRGALGGAVRNTVTQGIAVATGLQKSFDWKGVAASALSGGIGQGLNAAMGYAPGQVAGLTAPANAITDFDLGRSLVSGLGGSIVGNAARGGKLNAASIAADAFGNVIGDSLAAANGQSASRPVADGQGGTLEVQLPAQAMEVGPGSSDDWVLNLGDTASTGYGPGSRYFGAAGIGAYPVNAGFNISGSGGQGITEATDRLRAPQTYAVQKGDTLEGVARQIYGDDWRTGMAVMANANNLSTNQWGSPLIRTGGELFAPSL
ncbi:YD repeat-containing protein, partial [Pseudacidovorax sp. 1753]|uniref:LysM peptidoglycan-binding domain-containing protein n=1 Tax=Pseudacidovorax sp. 1753 TaxID=3156419 RepID=UPI003396A301